MRLGWLDTMQASRLNHVTGTTYPAALGGTYLALFSVMPTSDGTGGTEVTGTRPSITLGSPTADYNGRHFMTNASAVTSITLANTSPAYIVGFGIYDAATSGNLYYIDHLPMPFQVAKTATISIAAKAVKVYAEPPTI